MMKTIKKICTYVLLFFAVGLSSCQELTPTPEVVLKTFQLKYTGQTAIKWEVDAHGSHEAHFKQDGIKYRADFSPDGSWIETETSISKKVLPKVIKEIIKRDYDYSNISEVEKVDHHKKGLFYDVEFKQKGKNIDVEFDAAGNLLNQ
jgi:hypothetical protein